MRNFIYIITTFLLVLFFNNSYAQTYNMPANGYLEIHSDSGTIYDDGGPTGNYSTRVNSVVTIYPSTPGAFIYLSGQYFLENSYKSNVKFYSGDTNSNYQINSISSTGCVVIKSTDGPLTIKFIADTETPSSGFKFDFRVCNDNPYNIHSPNITDTTAEIRWSEHDTATNWIVEYSDNYFSIGNGTKILTDTNYVKLDSLESCKYYYYYVYTACDTISNACGYLNISSNSFTTYSINSNQPYNVNYTINCNNIELIWSENDTNITWVSSIYKNNIKYSTQSNIPYVNFDSLKSGTGYSINICPLNNPNNCNCYSTWLSTNCCCPIPNNLHEIDVGSNYATIGWDADTNAEGWIVGYKISTYPYDSLNFITVNTNQVTINNLTPVRPYEVRVYSLCDSLRYNCFRSININTDISGLDNCFTFTNLKDTNFSPRYGTYSNPNIYHGLLDNGYTNGYSRHTVHYDTSEVDPRTGGLLRTVPPGEEASVRLGNWLPGGEGESFTYAYDVDTNIFDLMYLRYAVVMENPGHTMTNQPRFTLEILNANDTLIDPVCGYADFYASDALGWNSVPGTVTIWKDWTLVGFDITPYHGQRILVRLTTRDCDEGGHFGYAYYHLKCGSKTLISSKCGLVDSNTFIAPIGFNYRWYSSANPSVTLSTERVLDAVVDSTVNYHCLVSSTENSSCTFLYTAYGGYRYPLSQLDYSYTWQNCRYTVDFTNMSTISPNGITPAGTGERCETTKWVFPDGDTITTLNAIKTFSDTTEIKVRLISGIANDQCISILDTVLKLERPYPNLKILGDSVVCKNDTAILFANHTGLSFWSNQDTTSSISFVPLIDTIYSLELIDSLGCYHIDSINIVVNPRDTIYISAEICDNEMYTSNGFNTNTPGVNELVLISQYGCDSVIYLDLTVNPTYNDTIYAEICQGTVYDLNGFNDSISGLYTLSLQSTKGCDSIVNLNLTVNPINNDTIYAVICEGETYSDFGFNENTTGIYVDSLMNIYYCDSIVYLNLIVGEKYNDTIHADICLGEAYNDFGFNETLEGVYTHNFNSQYGCDSVIYLDLTVNPTYNDTIYAEICQGLVYDSNGFSDSTSGFYTLYLNTIKGCDSIVNLNLIVHPTYNDTIFDDICIGEIYSDYGFNERETGFYTQNLQTIFGCDSIVNLNLIVGEKYNDTIYANICEGETFNEFGFTETKEGLYTHNFLSQYGCDSIVNLNLLVHNPYYDTIYDTICQGDIYEFGFEADSIGTYVQNLNTTFGCDSILVLHLHVNPSYHDTIKADIYKENIYNQFGFNEKETGIYEQKLQTYLGCDSIIYLDLQVDYVLFPNVVTPNGDGINDIFEIHNLVDQNAFPENELIIYNRNGKIIYRAKNIKSKKDQWDPQATGSSEGTYFYRFYGKRHDKVLEFNGSIEVMR